MRERERMEKIDLQTGTLELLHSSTSRSRSPTHMVVHKHHQDPLNSRQDAEVVPIPTRLLSLCKVNQCSPHYGSASSNSSSIPSSRSHSLAWNLLQLLIADSHSADGSSSLAFYGCSVSPEFIEYAEDIYNPTYKPRGSRFGMRNT